MQANIATLTANSDTSFAYAVVVSRSGWISCLIGTRATEILLSARSGCQCCLKVAMYLIRLLPRKSLILPEDTEMEALHSHVLGEERDEPLPVRPSTQHQLEMSDIRRTPINEFN